MSEIRMFQRKDGQAERMLGVLAFMQAHRLAGRVLMVYDTRSRSMCAAIRYESDMPVALLGFLAEELGPVEYVQADRGRAVLGAADARLRLSGGFRFDGLELSRDQAVWREAVPRPA